MRGKDPKKARPQKPAIALVGAAGVGKTWFSLDWPMAYFCDSEGGANLPHYVDKLVKAKGLYVGREDGASEPDVILQEIKELVTTKHDRKTLILDSYSYLWNTMLLREYQRLVDKGQDPEGFFGRDKKPAIAFSKRLVGWIERLDMNVLLICHVKDEWKDGKVVRQTFDGWEKMEYALNLVVHVAKQGNKRVGKTMKSRFAEFPEGEVFDLSYNVFAERFGHDTLEAESTPVVLATPEQVTTLTELIKVLRVEQETIDKWLAKANAESFADMDTGTIDKCIQYLTNRVPQHA